MEESTIGRLTVAAKIENLADVLEARRGDRAEADVRGFEVTEARVDPDAFGLLVPRTIVDQLGLEPIRTRADSGVGPIATYRGVRLAIQGRDCILDVEVTDGELAVIVGRSPLASMDWDLTADGRGLIDIFDGGVVKEVPSRVPLLRRLRPRISVRWLLAAVAIIALMAAPVARMIRSERSLARVREEYRELKFRAGLSANLATVSLDSMKVSAPPGRIHIEASGRIWDRRGTVAYVWEIKLIDPATSKILMSRRYEEQVITPPWNVTTQVNFAADLAPDLPQGSCAVDIRLHEFPIKLGVKVLDDPVWSGGSQVLGGRRTVDFAPAPSGSGRPTAATSRPGTGSSVEAKPE